MKAPCEDHNPGWIPTPSPSSAVGADAMQLYRLISGFKVDVSKSVSLGATREATLDNLYRVFEKCSQLGWDGYGGIPASYDTYIKAKQFVDSFPTALRPPEISVDPDGEFSFEWYAAPRKVFTVSVGPNNQLSYAGLFGASKTHGTETFHDEIPSIVIELVRRVVL